ncbi:MAG: hypothetical protein QW794_04025 [Thermosphaera sp.]
MAEEKRQHKFKQIVWLDGATFMKVIEVSNKTGMAPNVVIAEVVKKYLNGGNNEPVKVIEKQVVTPMGFYCPFCLKSFRARNDLLDHLKFSDCNQKLREWIW